MGIQKIEIGDIFEVPTAIGNAYIQYMAEVDQTTLIRLLPGVYHEPVDLEKLAQQKERYICFVPLGIALRRKYIRKVGFSEVKKFKVPKYFKDVEKVCGVFKGMVQHLSIPGEKRLPRTGENDCHHHPCRYTTQCRSR